LGNPSGGGTLLVPIETTGHDASPQPEPSRSTHFFQDLMEDQIYPLVVCMDEPVTAFNDDFFYHAPDHTGEWLPDDPGAHPSRSACG
jgi:hypothetical protein